MSWMLLWKIVFVIGISGFALMAVWVTIAGAKDIKRLFKRIEESHEEGEA